MHWHCIILDLVHETRLEWISVWKVYENIIMLNWCQAVHAETEAYCVHTSHAVPGLKKKQKTKKQELNPAPVLVWPKTCRSRFEVREKNLTRPLEPICENQCGMCSVTGAACTGRSVLWRTSPSMLGNSEWQTDTLGICHSSLFKSSLSGE